MVAIIHEVESDPLMRYAAKQAEMNWELLEKVRALQSEVREKEHQVKVIKAERDHWRGRVIGA